MTTKQYLQKTDNVAFHQPRKLKNEGIMLDYNGFSEELSNAQYSLGLLQGSQRRLESSSLLISPLTAKEAKESSGIEGTVTTLSDIFLYEAGGKPKYGDTQQVVNYRTAMTYALKELSEGKPITKYLIQTLHQILLKDVRHKGIPGKFRDEIVYIADKDTDPIEKATYIPMKPLKITEYIDNLLDYINNGKENVLIKTGIFHYQFEAIHPFSDGNGRIGRLLIPLLLFQKNKLSQPILYISGYLEKNRAKYIEALHSADTSDKYEQWLSFYLKSVAEQLLETQKLIDNIYNLHDKIIQTFDKKKSPFIPSFIGHLFTTPFTTIPMAKKEIGASTRNTVAKLINEFITEGIITETKSTHQRAKIYAFKELVKLLH